MTNPNAGVNAQGDAFVKTLEKNAQAGAKNEGFIVGELMSLLKELETHGVQNLPEDLKSKIMSRLSSGKQALASFPSGVTNVLGSFGDTVADVGTTIAENAAPVAKKSLDVAAMAHILSIIAKEGVIVGGVKSVGAGINNAITVAAGKFAIDRLEKMLLETGNNAVEALA